MIEDFQYSIDNRQSATDIEYQMALQELMRMSVRFFVQYLDYWTRITVIINSIHKPPRPIGMRIEKILPLPGDHGSLIQT